MADRDPEIQALLDKQAIAELSFRYSRACDRLDSEMMASVYWPDGTDDHGSFKGTAPEYVDWVMDFVGKWTSTHHDNSNILIDLDGDKAYGEVHWTGFYSYDIDGVPHDHLAAGRYLDRYERRGGEWRIKHRTCVSEWTRIEPATSDWRVNPPRNQIRGARSRDDMVYDLKSVQIIQAAE